jgi:hypothetical protein
MKLRNYLLILPLAFVGCAYEAPAPPVTTTTTVTRETTTTGPVAGEVLVTQAPPAPRVEVQTVAPGPGYVWTPGYWRWTGTDYVWTSGAWVVRPRANAVYVRGHWEHRAGGWVWIPGHWRY